MSQRENSDTAAIKDAPSPAVRPRVVVIGAGVTGLAAAYEVFKLLDEKVDLAVLEAMGRVGGTINTYDMGDLVLELGPDSFFTQKPVMLDVIRRLGIEERVMWTATENRRTFIAYEEKLWELPEGFAMFGPTKLKPFFDSPLFSLGGKLRAMWDLALPKSSGKDESLSAFIKRRMGNELLERVIQPLVAGMYTADPDVLSVRSALPRLYDLEQKYGSVTRGLMAEAQKSGNNGSAEEGEGGPRYGLFATLDGGMSVLIDAFIKALPLNTVRTQAYAVRIEPSKQEGKRWDVVLFDGTVFSCDAVIVATPACRAADVLQGLSSEAADKLRTIQHASSIVVNCMFYRDDVPHPLDGFGFVVPRSEKRSIIACSFSSNKFPGRAPKDKVLMRVFFGGALQPEVYDFADEHLQCLLWEDLHNYMGIKALPVFTMVTRHPLSMPQYHVGHADRVGFIQGKLSQHPGVELAGNAYQGVGIPDCILSGQAAAKKVVALISQAGDPAAPGAGNDTIYR
jgi:oxygen-dependent protoporphyrinogen oxidase